MMLRRPLGCDALYRHWRGSQALRSRTLSGAESAGRRLTPCQLCWGCRRQRIYSDIYYYFSILACSCAYTCTDCSGSRVVVKRGGYSGQEQHVAITIATTTTITLASMFEAIGLTSPKTGPRSGQDRPRSPKMSPRSGQDGPKRGSRSPKMGPRKAQDRRR